MPTFKADGCYGLKALKPQSDAHKLINLRNDLYGMYKQDPNNVPEIIDICAVIAKAQGYTLFGIRAYGVCGGVLSVATLDNATSCVSGVGQNDYIYVYQFT